MGQDSASPLDRSTFRAAERAVLCYVRDGDRVLLIEKKRGLGAGKVNGPGGKIEPGETAMEAAIREVREEVGVVPDGLVHAAVLRFAFLDGYRLEVHVFFAYRFAGEPQETDEAVPFWCRERDLPFDRMWEDDRLWLPHALSGTRVDAIMEFDGEVMTQWHLTYSNAQPVSGRN